MTPEQLQAALNALMEAGLDGDALAAATKALTDAFSSTAEVTDADATDAMAPGAAAAFRAAETSEEDKAVLLEEGRFQARARKIAVALAAAKATPAKDSKKDDVAPTMAQFRAVIKEEITKALPGAGRQADPKANPLEQNKTASAGFSAKVKTIMGTGVTKARAIATARNADPKGFQEFCKTGSKLD